MREIVLKGDEIALVDDADFLELSRFQWSIHTTGYAQRRVGTERIYMHMAIVGKGFDHRNGDRLDNRRINLRPATRSQNNMNKGLRSDNRSGWIGVGFYEPFGKWRARIKLGRIERATFHETPREAAVARDRMAKELHGEFARLNFPEQP